MKKTLYTVAFVVIAVIVASCSSTGTYADQADVDAAFDKVYNTYKGDIILEGAASYTVDRGDTLSKFTKARYGADNTYFFPLIMLASSEVVKDPDFIQVGMKLTIPDLQRNLNNPTAKSKVKAFINDIAVVYDRKEEPRTAKTLRELAGTL
jgi:hypothetical protein